MKTPAGYRSISVSDVLTGDELGDEERPNPTFDPGSVGDEGGTPDDQALIAALQSIGETQENAFCNVYQIDGKSKKDVFLFKAGVAEFAATGLEDIQSNYGAGDYRIRVYSNGRGILANRRVQIGAPLKTNTPEKLVSGIEGVMTQQMQMMMLGFNKLGEVIVQSNAQKQQAPQGMSMREVIELMAVVNGSRRNDDPFEMLTKLMMLKKELEPSIPEGTDSGTAITLKAIEMLGKPIMEGMAAKAHAPQFAPPAVLNPAPHIPPAQLPAPQAAQSTDEDVMLKLSVFKGPLLIMAQTNANPLPYAEMLFDVFDEAQIEKYVMADNWRDELEKVLPEAAQHREWFAGLRAAAVDMLQLPGDDDMVAENSSGPVADATSGK